MCKYIARSASVPSGLNNVYFKSGHLNSYSIFCNIGYVLGDCSLPTATVPEISAFRRGCTCDVRQFRCALAYVRAKDIYSSENFTCMLQSANSWLDPQDGGSILQRIDTVNMLP